MERWEPPKATVDKAPIRSRRMPQLPSRDLPEIWLMVAARLGITLLLAIAVIFEGLRNQMHFAVLVLVGGLLILVQQSNQDRTRRLRNMCIVDLTILIAVVPVAIFAGFVAAEPGELLPAESSAFIETSVGMVLAIAVVTAVAYRFFADEPELLASVVLPAVLTTMSLAFVLHDYRNQTVIAMLAVSYFAGAAAIALGVVVDDPLRRYLAAIFYVCTVLAGALLFDPGIGNLADREPLIQVVSSVMIVLGMLVLTVVAMPSFQPARMIAGTTERTGRRTLERRSGSRSQGDTSRATEERSR